MPRRQLVFLIGIVLAALAATVMTAVWENEPLLGLDLQGGVSVRLTATEPATEEMLDQAVGIIRNRVDALGVAEPEVSRTADGVMVSLPGVDDQQRALDLVGTTAELRFRPVCDVLPVMTANQPGQGAAAPAPASCSQVLGGGVLRAGVTPPEHDHADQFVILGGRGGTQRYLLGPSVLTGDALSDANADLIDFQWQVAITLKSGADGIDAFNRIDVIQVRNSFGRRGRFKL